MRLKPEQQLCKSLMDFVRVWKVQKKFHGIILYISNNQSAGKNKKSQIIAQYMDKLMGQRAGVADYLVIDEKGKAYFLEAKAGKNKQQDNQKDFESEVKGFNCDYRIFRTIEEAEEIFKEWRVLKC